ncbi:MAG TPA: ABC transporter permease [Solirubrobacteraceae bacterium]|jgi:ABC-2 type transport system permease protein|nr:ABC transporter permease [Solirubrobacteraceae bacterium]
MRWLLLKDLRILRRSPLLVGVLVVYPIIVALLIGLALSRGPSRPRVALLNEVPAAASNIQVGSGHIDIESYERDLNNAIVPVPVATLSQALSDVRSGDVLAAVVIPPDITARLSTGLERAQVQVIYNGNALTQSFVQNQINSELATANFALSAQLDKQASRFINLLVTGGTLPIFGSPLSLYGLRPAQTALQRAIAAVPPRERPQLAEVESFLGVAVQNIGLASDVLSAVSHPIEVKQTLLSGRRTPLNTFAIAVAATLSLMFVCLLLASGALALEREENAYGRLVRGLVRREVLLAEKILLAAVCSAIVTAVMLAGISIFVHLDWGRAWQWVVGLLVAGVAFGALGVAIGALAREVRAASLLAFLLSLPLAFLALVPSGSVAKGLYDVFRVISAVFPFKPALEAMDAAINGSSPAIGGPLLWLAGLTLLFALLGRLAMRRLGS